MVILNTWQDIVNTYEEVGELFEQDQDFLDIIAADPRIDECVWAVFDAKCGVCGYRCMMVVPFLPSDIDFLANLLCQCCKRGRISEVEDDSWRWN